MSRRFQAMAMLRAYICTHAYMYIQLYVSYRCLWWVTRTRSRESPHPQNTPLQSSHWYQWKFNENVSAFLSLLCIWLVHFLYLALTLSLSRSLPPSLPHSLPLSRVDACNHLLLLPPPLAKLLSLPRCLGISHSLLLAFSHMRARSHSFVQHLSRVTGLIYVCGMNHSHSLLVLWFSHVTPIYAWVMSHIWISHVMHKSCHTYDSVM